MTQCVFWYAKLVAFIGKKVPLKFHFFQNLGLRLGLGLGLGSLKKERPRPRPRPRPRHRVFLTPVTHGQWVQGTLGLRGCLQLGNSIITCSVLCTYSAYIFIKPQPFIIETAAQIVSLVLTN